MDDFDERDDSAGLPAFLLDPIGILRRRWLLVCVIAALGLVASVAVALLQKPTYSAKATVLVASQKVATDFVRPTIEEDPFERVNALLGEVLSVDNLNRLIEKHDLYSEQRESVPRELLVARMRRNIQVAQEVRVGSPVRFERAQILGIAFTGDRPEEVAPVANDLAQLFIDAGIRMRSEQARLTTEFMRRELKAAEEALRDHTRKIAEFQETHRGELPNEMEAQLARLERLQSQRTSLAMQIVEAETRLATIRADYSRRGEGGGAAARLATLQAALQQELSVNTDTHPNVQALRRQIAAAERQGGGGGGGGSGGGGVVAAVQREIDQLRQQLAETDQQLIELDAKVARIPALGEEFSALQQRATVIEQTYTEYMRKVKEAELAESLERAQQGARVSVLDRAFPPTGPERSPWKLAGAAFIASLGLAGLAALVLEWRDPVLSTTRGIEAAGGGEVLGSIPRMA